MPLDKETERLASFAVFGGSNHYAARDLAAELWWRQHLDVTAIAEDKALQLEIEHHLQGNGNSTVARKTLSLKEECQRMDDKGIIHGMRASGLDEAPGAYKNIGEVMQLESDLVKPTVELAPLAVIKGD